MSSRRTSDRASAATSPSPRTSTSVASLLASSLPFPASTRPAFDALFSHRTSIESEEDLQLKNELEMLAERLKESNTEPYQPALETLRTLIRTSTSSMTSVPKPLKFLRPLYPDLQALYETWPASEDKSLFADILSVLAMTYSDTQPRGTLCYRLLSASLWPAGSPLANPGTWGHEYARHLAAELGDEYTFREEGGDLPTPTPEAGKEEKPEEVKLVGTIEDLRALGKERAVFLIGRSAEPDAVDLLEELEIVDEIAQLVDDNTYGRVCQHMIRCVNLLPPPGDISFLRTAHTIYVQHHKFPEALALAIRPGEPDLIREDFNASGNPLMKRQLAFLLARAQIPIEWLRAPSANPDEEIDIEDEFPEDLRECLSNTRMSTHFREFGKELGAADPKSLGDVYKAHLENTCILSFKCVNEAAQDQTLWQASIPHAGISQLMVETEEGNSWVYKNKGHDLGLSHVDKYTYSAEEHIKAGALLATGIPNSGVRTEANVAKGLTGEYVDSKSVPLKTSATMGLALAYAGSHCEDLLQLLIPHISDDGTMEVASLATLALGFIFVGSENGEIAGTILQTLMEKAERSNAGLDEKWARFMALGLGLLYLGLQDASDTTIETLKAIEYRGSRHQASVQLATSERAELATGEFTPFRHALEGFVASLARLPRTMSAHYRRARIVLCIYKYLLSPNALN
ncbi:hypothetical protein C8R44DRAFT_919755 [Mycena epipterygia]|nr:hypothetical protein C8R44DRAFT_919755 [Mycena epipterygia]